MQVGLSTASFFPSYETPAALDIICKYRAPVCEVFMNGPSQYSPVFAKQCLKKANDAGVKIVSVHAMASQYEPQLFSPLASQRSDAQDTLRRVLEAAAVMEARAHSFHGLLYYLNRPPGPMDYDKIARQTAEILKIYCEFDIIMAWENVHYAIFHKPDFPNEVQNRLYGADNLMFCLDVKQAALSYVDPCDFIEGIGDRLSHVHLCDVQGRMPRLPGEGELDFPALAAKLAECRAERKLSVMELEGSDSGVSSMRPVPALLETYASCSTDVEEIINNMKKCQEIFAYV
ncbi:MAG: sugar phosphate isomerase/epimerase [Clostridia bacterium]|nr:sugar phosphate isomerase/epimerase [Clostridia bacterium]